MIVTDQNGVSEILTDYKELTRKRQVNGDHSLSFIVIETERNAHAFPLVENENFIEYDGYKYRIKQSKKHMIGNRSAKTVQASHVLNDFVDKMQYDTLTGTLKIDEALRHALAPTGYTFVVLESYQSVEFENFGADNALALFQKILERYGAEYEVDDKAKHITIRKQIGMDADFQFRYRHNIKTFEMDIDTTNLSTYIRGFGKKNEDGTYVVTAEYTSPNASKYKDENGNVDIKHAPAVNDERYTTYDGLLERLKAELNDVPDITFSVEFVELRNQGYPYSEPGLGDRVYVIYEPLDIDYTARIVEIEDYPESPQSPKVTLANLRENVSAQFRDKSFSGQIADVAITQYKMFDPVSEKLRYEVFDKAVQVATEALNNALTELEFPKNGGIVARDKTDADNLVVFNSAGIGVSTDGGKTYRSAITAKGVVAELIVGEVIRGVRIEGGSLSTVPVNGNSVVVEKDSIISNVNDRMAVQIANYQAFFYDSGTEDRTPTYDMVGKMGASWESDDKDMRGFSIVGTKDYISISRKITDTQHNPIIKAEFGDINRTRIAGGDGYGYQSSKEPARLYLMADRSTPRFLDGPGMVFYRGWYKDSTVFQAGIDICFGDYNHKAGKAQLNVFANMGDGTTEKIFMVDRDYVSTWRPIWPSGDLVQRDAFNLTGHGGGWSNYGGGYEVARCHKDRNGYVHLSGLIRNGTGDWVFILPAGYRPRSTEVFVVMSSKGECRIDVANNGNVNIKTTSVLDGSSWVSLSGICFKGER